MKQKGSASVILLVGLLVALSATSVYFWQKYEQEKEVPGLTVVEDTETSEEMVAPEGSEMAPEESAETVVVYTPGGLFTEAEKAEINTKLVNPFIDWNEEINQFSVSFEIEKLTPEVAGYRYEVTYINDGGGNGGFLYGTSEPLEWWLPACMGGCNFSPEFEAKYPEIVAQSE